jgi:predicted metal-dependent phosphoesterase TrpH
VLDLHAHSDASDGSMSPTALVELGSGVGLTALALTDHDTVAGVAEAARAAVGKRVRFVPGVELSARMDDGTLHICGLFIDCEHPAMAAFLADVLRLREARNARLIARLAEIGMPVTLDEAVEASGGEIVGRPHFAAVLIRKGFAGSMGEVFSKILGRGGVAHVFKERREPGECIAAIRAAGGVPVLAHPDQTNRKGAALDDLVGELRRLGLAGIETFCTSYTSQMVQDYTRLAKRHGLARSGGSDFHGAPKPDVRLGRGFGSLHVPDSLLAPLEEAAARIRATG